MFSVYLRYRFPLGTGGLPLGDRSRIEWTNATWNPATGCTRVSAGCDNCYALALANGRLAHRYAVQPPARDTVANRADPFAVRLWPERLAQPGKWRKQRMIFVNSMSDVFHRDIPDDFVRQIFKVMLEVDRHIYQVLTKRPGRALRFVRQNASLFKDGFLPNHIWLGTSVENESVAYRVDQLRKVPAAVRFLSCEPLLGELAPDLEGIHWVIVGGESGPAHRPMDLDWARKIRDTCVDQEVPFFFKQVGGRTPKAGGRLLDGETWDQFPAGTAVAP